MSGSKVSGKRALAAPIAVAVTVAAVFTWLFAAALHQPEPHGLRLGIVAPDQIAAAAAAGIEQASPGGFVVTRYGSADEVRAAIANRDVVGALAVGQDGATIMVAGATGKATVGAVSAALTAVAAQAGATPSVEDVRPLPANDPNGLVPFFLLLGVDVSALSYQILAYVLAGAAPLRSRLAALLGFAVLDGFAAAVAVALVLGFEPSFWLLWAMCSLLALAVASATAALQELFGLAGTAVSAIVVVLFGAACSGSIIGADFLPDAFRALSPVLPPGAALYAIRGTLYFDGAGLTVPVAVLVTWSVVALAVIAGWAYFRRPRAAEPPAAVEVA